jgi:hypothetical protein
MDTLLEPQKPAVSIDVITKATALVALLIYACGFLVVTLHLSAFGFVEVNPLKPRVVTAGAYFLAAVFVPTYLAYVIIRIDGITDRNTRRAALFSSILFYYVTCQLIGDTLLVWLSGSKDYGEILVFMFLMIPWLIGARKIVTKVHPNLVVATSILFVIFLLARSGILIHRHRWDGAIELWFFLVGLEGRWNILLFRKSKEERLKFPLIVIVGLPLLFVFATVFYPRINSAWGGGSPLPVTLCFSKDSALMPSGELEVQLIDESDLGLYVLVKQDKRAVFIPRTSITLIRFSEEGLVRYLWSTEPTPKPSQ